MVEVGTSTSGGRYTKTDWPTTEGLTLGTTKLPAKAHLEPEETKVPESEHWGSI